LGGIFEELVKIVKAMGDRSERDMWTERTDKRRIGVVLQNVLSVFVIFVHGYHSRNLVLSDHVGC